MDDTTAQKYLSDVIEKVIFDENELNSLKMLIQDVSIGKLEAKQLRAAILERRVSMMEKIVKLFPFLQKKVSGINDPKIVGDTRALQKLEKELEERNSLLENIGSRMQSILSKAQK